MKGSRRSEAAAVDDLEWFIETSVSLGSSPQLVQGTGGNLSVKSGGRMIIKSSGVRMDAVRQGYGYSVVDRKMIADMYSKDIGEEEAGRIMESSILEGMKPSIETGFHSFLGKYVIHLHPVHANVILCCEKNAGMLEEIFQPREFLRVPYAKVGHKLASEIKKLWNGEGLIFLENHGIIISSDNPGECMKILSFVEGRIEEYLASRIQSFEPFSYAPPVQSKGFCASACKHVLAGKSGVFSGFLFPDAAVFSLSEKIKTGGEGVTYLMDYGNAVNVDSVLASHAYIKETASKIGTLKYLTQREVDDILGMESEKYRRKMVGV